MTLTSRRDLRTFVTDRWNHGSILGDHPLLWRCFRFAQVDGFKLGTGVFTCWVKSSSLVVTDACILPEIEGDNLQKAPMFHVRPKKAESIRISSSCPPSFPTSAQFLSLLSVFHGFFPFNHHRSVCFFPFSPRQVLHLPADVRAERLRGHLDAVPGCLAGGEDHSALATGLVPWEPWMLRKIPRSW